MNRGFYILYFIFPAIVVALPLRDGVGSVSAIELVVALVMNYVFFALPQISWFVVSRFVQAAPSATHAGYLGASIPLLGLAIAFECCIWNENALGWFYYWPLAGAGMLCLLLIVRIFAGWHRREA